MPGGYPCRCCGCDLYIDLFKRREEPGYNWQAITGDWYTGEWGLYGPPDAEGICKCLVPHPAENVNEQVWVAYVTGGPPYGLLFGKKARLFVDYVDENNCWYGELHWYHNDTGRGCKGSLYQRVNGVDILRGASIYRDPYGWWNPVFGSIWICISGGAIRLMGYADYTITPSSPYAAVGTTTESADLAFCAFVAKHTRATKEGCEECAPLCPDCVNSILPPAYEVEINNAGNLDGTYYIPRSTYCGYIHRFTYIVRCGYFDDYATKISLFPWFFTGKHRFRCEIDLAWATDGVAEIESDEPIACSEFNGTQLPIVYASGCVTTDTIIKVTAIWP